MKKKYMNPETVVVELEAQQSLLAGSMNVLTGEVSSDKVLSPGFPTIEDPFTTLENPFDVLNQFGLE